MKLNELFETVTSGAVSAGDIAGNRAPLFKREIRREYIIDVSKLFKKRKKVAGIPKISFKQNFGNNIKG